MAFDFGKYDRQHLRNIAQMAREIEALFEQLNQKAVQLVTGAGIDASSEDFDFFFGDFPAVNKQMGDALQEFHNSMQGLVERRDEQAWLLSNEKNAAMLASLQKRAGWSDERLQQLQKPNVDALQAFQQRKENGMNLSQRVWNLTEQHKQSLELALECGLADGTDARKLSQVVRRYLNEPNRLFRRVRDKKTGQLRLSKAAAAYHPGRGVYRSSYKNALRMTGTEINMAYRTADTDKWQQLDIVLGVEVHVSPTNHTLNGVPFFDICDQLQGTYPKEFKFIGWHPNCRCMAVPKLPSRKELARYKKAIWEEKEQDFSFRGNVTDMPERFTSWVAENTEKILSARNTPYFIRDNYTGGNILKGYRWLTTAEKKVLPLTTLEKAAQRHAARTQEQIDDIRQRAANRELLLEHRGGFLARDVAQIRGWAREYGIDISAFEKRYATEKWEWTNNLRKEIAGGVAKDIQVLWNKCYDRYEAWEDFINQMSNLRQVAMNMKGAKAKAVLKRLNLEEFGKLKTTFTKSGLDKIRKGFVNELNAITKNRVDVLNAWNERRNKALAKNAGSYALSATDKAAAEHLAKDSVLSPVEWASSLSEAEAELFYRKKYGGDFRRYLYGTSSAKDALVNKMRGMEKACSPHLDKIRKFINSKGFVNLSDGVAKKAEQFVSDYYKLLMDDDSFGALNALNGADNLIELIKRGADFKKTSMMMPYELLPNEKWLGADITLDKSFFDKFKSFVRLEIKNDSDGYYSPVEKMVHFGFKDNRYSSKKWRQQLVYHEFGHSQGDKVAFGIDFSNEVADVMQKWRKKFKDKKHPEMLFGEKYRKYTELSREALKGKTGEERAELVSEWCAFSDIFGALHKSSNYQFYGGHGSSYWKQKGHPEAEFVAHCFEFKFIGNPIAKKYEPELYEAMVGIIDKLFKY